MRKAIYDIEGDGLLTPVYDKKTDTLRPAVSKIWCIVICDITTGEYFKYRPDEVIDGYKKLQEYDLIIAHNGKGYDEPALEKVVGVPNNLGPLPPHGDTYIMGRLLYGPTDAPTPSGLHGIQSWGEFFGSPKHDFHEWDRFSEEMLDYCVQDVVINVKIYDYLSPKMTVDLLPAYQQELKSAGLFARQMQTGVHLDVDGHARLMVKLEEAKAAAAYKLKDIMPPGNIIEMKTREYWIAPDGCKYRIRGDAPSSVRSSLKPGPFIKKIKPFNPVSGAQLADYFINVKGYKPTAFTDKGNPSFGAEVLDGLPYPEAEAIMDYRVAADRLSQCQSWDNYLTDEGKIHGSINSVGAATYRCTHNNPNLANVPAARKPFGKECRAAFKAPDGKVLTGTDAKGLELRMLGNGLHAFDGGKYIDLVLSGEIHPRNQSILGLPTVDEAKTCIYAFNYSAGLLKLGKIVQNSIDIPEDAKSVHLPPQYIEYLKEKGWYTAENIMFAKMGSVVRKRLYGDTEGLTDFISMLKEQLNSKGYVVGIDGRRIPVEKDHTILNRRLQSDGGIVMKYALNLNYDMITAAGFVYDVDWAYVLNIHDEWQEYHDEKDIEFFQHTGNESIRLTGENLNIKCPLAGDSASGKNWSVTH